MRAADRMCGERSELPAALSRFSNLRHLDISNNNFRVRGAVSGACGAGRPARPYPALGRVDRSGVRVPDG